LFSLEQLLQTSGRTLAAAGIEEPHREAQLIISRAAQWDLGQLILKSQEPLPTDFPLELIQKWVTRRAQREPMAYIFGERDFFGRSFFIGPGALIPRPDSETLIEWVLEDHPKNAFTSGLDLCCGPGTLGLTLAQEIPCPFELVDISEATLAYAQRNQQHFGLSHQTKLHQLDLLQQDLSPLAKVDLMVCNPPYVPTGDLPRLMPEVAKFEPHLALFGGKTGLEFFEALWPKLSSLAKPGCKLYVELGLGQRELLEAKTPPQGWTREAWRQDLAGICRVVCFTFLNKYHG
jgi:release factor glutamine methyltransferase